MDQRLARLIVLLAAAAVLLVPGTASASQVGSSPTYTFWGGTRVSDNPRYTGWARVDPNYCAPGQICIRIYRTEAAAWEWRGYWQPRSVKTGAWVYVSPYAAGWSWAWTPDRGWLAMRSSNLVYGALVML